MVQHRRGCAQVPTGWTLRREIQRPVLPCSEHPGPSLPGCCSPRDWEGCVQGLLSRDPVMAGDRLWIAQKRTPSSVSVPAPIPRG